MTRTVTIIILDTPAETTAIARALHRFLLNHTPALVYDDKGEGSAEQPRRIEATFPQVVRTLANDTLTW